jgi:hypothetical protein
MVLCKILQTLDSCVECPSGRLLGDSDICAIFQAVYRIGFDTQVAAELSGALTSTASLSSAFNEVDSQERVLRKKKGMRCMGSFSWPRESKVRRLLTCAASQVLRPVFILQPSAEI